MRGAGTALALPLLDAMIPALRADRFTAAAPVRRLGFVFYTLGVNEDRWRPKGEGADYQLSEALAPLAPHRNKFVVLSGLSSDPDRTKAGFHDRALASFMTGVEMVKGKIQVGISVDQVAAQALGKETQFASLELATEYNGALGRRVLSRARPLRCRSSPIRAASSSGFSATAARSTRSRPRSAARPDQSSLDTVTARIAELKARLGPSDRRKLDEYLQSIRDIERRIKVAMEKKPVGPARK